MSPPTLWQRLTHWLQAAPAPRPHRQTPAPASDLDREVARQQRATQREKLHAVVHEHMIRTGVLSGAYKFKSLPLDRHGQSFIVLLDINATAMASDAIHQAEWEASLQTLAQDRLNTQVKGVYWRVHQAAASAPKKVALHPPDFAPTQPMEPASVPDAHDLGHTQPGALE